MNTLQKAGLLQLLPKMSQIDAMKCMQAFSKAYGEHLDWHEFSYYLDELNTKRVLKVVKLDIITGYVLND